MPVCEVTISKVWFSNVESLSEYSIGSPPGTSCEMTIAVASIHALHAEMTYRVPGSSWIEPASLFGDLFVTHKQSTFIRYLTPTELMELPKQYQWLNGINPLPKTIQLALKEYGIQEVVGKGSNKTIISWRDELNQAGVKIAGYSDDDIPWCGLFAAIVTFRRANVATEVVKDPLWARNWEYYGVRSNQPGLGDILVFVRDGGGHVGFYIGETSDAYLVLGGNQGNRVSITSISKTRCIAKRRPPYLNMPATVKPFYVTSAGKLSTNEA